MERKRVTSGRGRGRREGDEHSGFTGGRAEPLRVNRGRARLSLPSPANVFDLKAKVGFSDLTLPSDRNTNVLPLLRPWLR